MLLSSCSLCAGNTQEVRTHQIAYRKNATLGVRACVRALSVLCSRVVVRVVLTHDALRRRKVRMNGARLQTPKINISLSYIAPCAELMK